MPSNPNDDSELLPASRIVSELAHLRQYPAHDLVAWQPQDVLDDQLLDAVGTYGKPETYSATVALPGASSTRSFPLPWLQLHGKSFTGILLWSFEGKPLAAFRRKCIELPGNPFHNVLKEHGRACLQTSVMQWLVT